MKKTIKCNPRRKKLFKAIAFPMMSTSVVTTNSIVSFLSVFQEKLLYITISLVFLCVMYHKICSRVSYEGDNNRRGG